jgi:hypothetical protein
MQAMLRRLAVLFVVALPAFAANLGSAPMNVKGVNLDLVSVERRGNVLTVKWAVTNSDKDPQQVKFGLKGKHTTSYIVDEESGTKYYALTDKEGNLLASASEYVGADTFGIGEWIKTGETKRYWAKFPAPPPAVKSINVLLSDTEPFEGVAITDK